ncbi:MAG: hypothetical protein WDN72_08650 [Alphaproteobacteria bacterium]
MATPGHPYQNLADLIRTHMARGENVVYGDYEHPSALTDQVLGDPDVLAAIHGGKGMLVLEGPQTGELRLQSYVMGIIDDDAIRRSTHVPYQWNDPAKNHAYNEAVSSLVINARKAGVPIFLPETGTLYDYLRQHPDVHRAETVLSALVTSGRCAPVQSFLIDLSLSHDERRALADFQDHLTGERSNGEDDSKTIGVLKTRQGPLLIAYGLHHGPILSAAFGGLWVSSLPTERSYFNGSDDQLPEYIHYADTDRVLHIPPGSPQRAEFVANHLSQDHPLSGDELLACVRALPLSLQPSALRVPDAHGGTLTPNAPAPPPKGNGKPLPPH